MPYFDSLDADTSVFAPLQSRAPSKKAMAHQPALYASSSQPKSEGKGPKRTGSGGKGKPGQQQSQQPAGGQPNRKHHRDPSQKNLTSLAAEPAAPQASSRRQSPPRKRQEHIDAAYPAEPSSKFAGPAFTISPMPDSLPIPTTSLLMTQAADRMKSGLVI